MTDQTDLTGMSDGDLLAALQSAPDVPAMVTAEAQRQGVDPALALSVAHAESGFDPSAVSPKGAVGPMQLMPATAKGLGVDPNDPAQNIRGGVSYLKQQLDQFGDPKLAVAAYNAGPGAVQRAGGIPQNSETPGYVDKVMGGAQIGQMSDADLMSALGMGLPAPRVAPVAGAPAGQPPTAPAPRSIVPGIAQQGAPQAPTPSPYDQAKTDAAQGFFAPIDKLVSDVKANYAKSTANARGPAPSIPQALAQEFGDLKDKAGILGDVGGVISAPIQAALNPLAGVISRYGPQQYSSPSLFFQGGKAGINPSQALTQPQAQAQTLGDLNTALSAATPSAGRVAMPAKSMNLDELTAAKNAAYKAVDSSGFRFPTADAQNLASDITAYVARKGGPKAAQLYPGSEAIAARLQSLANQPGGVPLSQLDELRSDIYGALVKPGDREAPIGVYMRGKIDDLINAHNTPDIAAARDLNTRVMKSQAITDKLDSAGLRAASTYSGGNYPNAVRQSLRTLVDPTSAQQITNLTPQENAALTKVVTGTPVQNATRYATKILTNKIVQAPIAVMTHGAGPAIMEAVGSVLNKTAQNQTQSAVQKVLDLISQGGRPPVTQPIPALQLAGRPPIAPMSPRGLFGLGVVAPANARAATASPK